MNKPFIILVPVASDYNAILDYLDICSFKTSERLEREVSYIQEKYNTTIQYYNLHNFCLEFNDMDLSNKFKIWYFFLDGTL